jgi:hypothetical protein
MRLIDADALMRRIEPILEAEEQIYGCSSWCFAIKCRDEVQDAPSVDAVPVRRGRWVKRLKNAIGYDCTACGKSAVSNNFDYCPYCGADMREVDDE